MNQQFASDNYSGICPEAEAMTLEANRQGHVPAYGQDDWTRKATDTVRELFEKDCDVFLVFNGTAANSLSLASLCQSYHSVIVHQTAHVETDECGAPEFFSNGSKLLTSDGENGRISPDSVEAILTRRTDIHFPKPKVLALSQATELGTIYAPTHLQALHDVASRHGLHIHMDGARFANAVATLDVHPREITWEVGVDVLSFGGTKNGLSVGEMVVFFNRELSEDFAYRCKQAGQLASKMRFLTAPWCALLQDDVWLRNARHSNRAAALLETELKNLGLSLLFPREANSVFIELSSETQEKLRNQGWLFYNFIGTGGVRLMCSWDTKDETIERFVVDLEKAL